MREIWSKLRLAAGIGLALLMIGHAAAQGVIQQSGPVVPFHAPSFYGNGIVGDAGTPQAPLLNSLGLFDGAQCPFGISSSTGAGATFTAYSLFTVCQTNTALTFYVQGLNGQSTPGVFFNIGGVSYPFPGAGGGNVVGPGSATANDPACFNGTSGSLLKDCGATGTGVAVLAASPALTGAPTAPTATAGTNTTQLATTAFVQAAVGAVNACQVYTAATNLTAPAMVNVSSTFTVNYANGATGVPANGFITASVTSGNPVSVCFTGQVGAFSGLNGGAVYLSYNTPGGVTSTPPGGGSGYYSQVVGEATSSSSLFFNPAGISGPL